MDSGYSSFKVRASRGRVFSTCFDTSIFTHNRLTLNEMGFVTVTEKQFSPFH